MKTETAQVPTADEGRLEAPVRHQRGDEMPMRVTTQGAIRVNSATVERDFGSCVLLCVDLHSKRATLCCTGGGDDESPSVCLAADDSTLNVDETQPRDSVTCIEFPTLAGWRIFAADGPSRYTLALTLLAPDA